MSSETRFKGLFSEIENVARRRGKEKFKGIFAFREGEEKKWLETKGGIAFEINLK